MAAILGEVCVKWERERERERERYNDSVKVTSHEQFCVIGDGQEDYALAV